jgi:hypothetical protein
MKNAGSYLHHALLAAGLVLGLGLWASPVSAQRADDMKNSQNPCVGDAQRICNEFIPDRSKVASCLFKNKSKLTAACRDEIGGGGAKKVGKAHKGKRHGRRHRRR